MVRKGLLARIAEASGSAPQTKSWSEPPFWALEAFRNALYGGSTWDRERIENDFEGYVFGAYKSDSIVFACIDRRQQVFSQARFLWRDFRNGRPGDLFGSPELGLLENPWPNGTTGELLALMEVDASLSGQFYATTVSADGTIGAASAGRPGRRIARMRPDWVTLVIDAPSGDPFNVDARVVAYLYEPRSYFAGPIGDTVTLLPSEVCHYVPKPDPLARFRGMSWLTPALREIESDLAITEHKRSYFEHGATPNIAVTGIQAATKEQFDEIVEALESRHAGAHNAYRTLYLAAGADAHPVSHDLKNIDLKNVQGATETRIATAAGVPSVILGNSEGLQGSSLNSGNFSAARRLFADVTIRDLWAKAAASLQVLVTPPRPGVSLWYDARDIPFLREDAKDDAEIRAADAQAIRTLTDAGYHPDAAVEFVRTGDLNRLTGQHSGLFSVQLQPPGTVMPAHQPPPEQQVALPPAADGTGTGAGDTGGATNDGG